MNKPDLKKNMLIGIETEDSKKRFRVLAVADKILVIDCDKKNMPMWIEIKELQGYVEMAQDVEKDSILSLEDLDSERKKIAYQRFNLISGIIPFLSDDVMRAEAIKRIAKDNQISSKTIRSYLCEYLAIMNIASLAPKKRNENRELSKDEKNIRKSLNRWYYTTKKRTLKSCYTLMLKNFYCDAEGKLLEEYPSFYQYRYFFRKYNKKETEYISRNGMSFYGRNQRPLIGNGVQAFAPCVGMAMLDSTICDIYLCNESGGVVGRPVLTIGIDAFSGLVCGYSLTWEGGIYNLRDMMLNMITDKVEHCVVLHIR